MKTAIAIIILGLICIYIAIFHPRTGNYFGQPIENWQGFVVGAIFLLIGFISAIIIVRRQITKEQRIKEEKKEGSEKNPRTGKKPQTI